MKKIHEDKFKIYYENTDSSGFAYHTAYLSMAERARSNMLNKDFSELTMMLKTNSKFFVVKKIKVDFIKPAKLFDNLDIITFYMGNSFTSLNLIQKICLLIFILTPLSWDIIDSIGSLSQSAVDSLFLVLLVGSFLGIFLFKTNQN